MPSAIHIFMDKIYLTLPSVQENLKTVVKKKKKRNWKQDHSDLSYLCSFP